MHLNMCYAIQCAHIYGHVIHCLTAKAWFSCTDGIGPWWWYRNMWDLKVYCVSSWSIHILSKLHAADRERGQFLSGLNSHWVDSLVLEAQCTLPSLCELQYTTPAIKMNWTSQMSIVGVFFTTFCTLWRSIQHAEHACCNDRTAVILVIGVTMYTEKTWVILLVGTE
jgi:hypothetical protein